MKMILSILTATALIATVSTGHAGTAEDFFKNQQIYGEHTPGDLFAEQELYGENVDSDVFTEQQFFGENFDGSRQ